MESTKKSINVLIYEQLTGQISESDLEELNSMLAHSEVNRENYNRIKNSFELITKYETSKKIDTDRAWNKFKKKHVYINTRPYSYKIRLKHLMRYAAILIPFVILLSLFLTQSKDDLTIDESDVVVKKSEQSGRNKAILTLPNGEEISLESAKSEGNIKKEDSQSIVQEQSTIQKNKSADLIQEENEKLLTLFNGANKLTTYSNSEYWITLDDGTKIHLNYNTSLIYPSKFNSQDRTVYLEGEAYFEVAKDKKRPFRVITTNGIVRQYGTSFNVNTYIKGQTKIILVEGSVGVTSINSTIEYKMYPGELATIDNETNIRIDKVDIEPYVAWNKGRFIFQDLPLDSMMNTISDWYGMKVVFKDEDDKLMRFTGDIDRYESVELVMKALGRATQLNIEIKENLIIVGKLKL